LNLKRSVSKFLPIDPHRDPGILAATFGTLISNRGWRYARNTRGARLLQMGEITQAGQYFCRFPCFHNVSARNRTLLFGALVAVTDID